ncbi:uncharacterized protein ATC70_000340 [Mucor velutinosus]|uniref:DUF3835 domain-containing protein n=1 Tax=Mucor velutinosus TaxID=708070 RepID=A0AAN7I1T1_9FUNG|nr:hypothetical protein ATC70_000340 [Mucor velutinosus]
MNEEGLPIMEIREELPPIDEKEEALKQKKLLEEKKKAPQPPSNQLPESVLRARKMMAEADERKKKADKNDENKALFDLLRELEEEEEEEEEGGGASTKQMGSAAAAAASAATEKKKTTPPIDEDSDELTDDFSDDEEDEDDDRYDTEISDNMFDRFGDDEQYPLDGVVDQEDFTCYDELPPQVPPAATLREIADDEDTEEYEKSTPKVITKKKVKESIEQPVAAPAETPSTAPKKMSKFKLAQQEKKNSIAAVKESSPLAQAPITESATPALVEPSSNETPKKKFSKFKLLRQEQKDRPSTSATPTATPPVSNAPVKELVTIPSVAGTTHSPATATATPSEKKTSEEQEQDEQLMRTESKKVNQGIPQVASVSSHKPRKMSRFKLQRAQSKPDVKEPATTTAPPLAADRIKPKRSVTWDANTDVRDHDYTSAPSVVAETLSYTQPMKTDAKKSTVLKQKIRSPADIFNAIKHTQGDMVDDYPSLDDDEDAASGNQVDLNELIKVARDRSEAFYRPNDGSEALIPMVKQYNDDDDDDEEEEEEKPNGIIVARKNKLDNKIMKGAVMERDIAPVDLEQVEDDMDLKEITSSYQQKRQSMLAATGGFSFATKPEFEVIEEDLPLPKKKQQQQEEEEEEQQEVAPKKMSRFKAARLGMRMDATEDNYY